MKGKQLQIKCQKSEEIYIKEVIDSTAAEFRMVNTIESSLVEQTIVNYSEHLRAGFGLGARRVNDQVIVDFNPCDSSPDIFARVFDSVSSKLAEEFGDRMLTADEKSYIPVQNTLPLKRSRNLP